MRVVLQRVDRASVTVEGETVGQIGVGLLALVGVGEGDDEVDAVVAAVVASWRDREATIEATAREGVRQTMGIDAEPDVSFVQRWERGIPNYAVGHLQAMEELFSRVKHHPQLYLNCNAYHGIAMNDCVRNSRELAERMCDG